MWDVNGEPIDANRFAPFEPVRVLNDYDGPRIFTFHADAAYLACWSDENDTHARFLVVPVTRPIIDDLERGFLPVREALSQPCVWVLDRANDGTLTACWLVDYHNIPEDAQPQPDTMLHRSLGPILTDAV